MLTRKLTLSAMLAVMLSAFTAHALDGQPLDRSNLTKTFGDEFDKFSWYAEGDVAVKGGGMWRTNFGYTWCALDDVKNHTLISNHEKELYVDPGFRGTSSKSLKLNPFSIKNGVLSITAARTQNPFLSGYRFTSGVITTEPSFTQTYGVFEMRAKIPKGRGYWPAFWLLPADKSWPPEIDVMEILGHASTELYTTLHSNANGTHTTSDIPMHTIQDASAGFHTYAVDWGPTETIFYFDDKEVGRRPTPADMNKPFYMLVNLAVGGDWPGDPTASTAFPQAYQIDYVHAYQRSSYAPLASAVAKPAAITPR